MQCDDFARSALDAFHRVGESITDAEINEAKNRLITKLLTQIDGKPAPFICFDLFRYIIVNIFRIKRSL